MLAVSGGHFLSGGSLQLPRGRAPVITVLPSLQRVVNGLPTLIPEPVNVSPYMARGEIRFLKEHTVRLGE